MATTTITVTSGNDRSQELQQMCSAFQAANTGDATTGGTWAAVSSSIATVNTTTGVLTGVSAGTTTIIYSAGTGCAATTTVTVNPSPAGTYNVGPSPICAGSTTTLTATYPSCAGTDLDFAGVPFGSAAIHTGVVTTVTDNLTAIGGLGKMEWFGWYTNDHI